MAGGSSAPARFARQPIGAAAPRRPALAATAILLFLLAVIAAGCGGGDDGGGTSTGPARERGTDNDGTGGDPAGDEQRPQGEGERGNDGSASAERGSGDSADDSAGGDTGGRSSGGGSAPGGSGESNSGGGSASGRPAGSTGFSEQSKPFRAPGGDNSIQTFGGEASGSELAAASAVLERYMTARAAGDWATQCDLLARAAVEPMQELLSRSPEFKGKGCAAILAALGSRADPALRKNTMEGPIASLRLEGGRAFALYHGNDGKDYFVPMALEAGEWKIASLGGPTELS